MGWCVCDWASKRQWLEDISNFALKCFFILLQVATEKDFLDAVNKVIKAYAKFSSTPRYMTYN